MAKQYEIRNWHGELVAEYPFTVDGLADAAHHAKSRIDSGCFSEIINPNETDIDNPTGLTETERDYLRDMWGIN